MLNYEFRNKARATLRIMIIVTIVAAVLIVLNRWINSELENTAVSFGKTQDFSQGWYYERDGQRLPVPSLSNENNTEETVYYHALADSHGKKQMLSFQNMQQQISVWVDDTCIYEYGSADPLKGKLFPSIQCFVPLEAQDGTHTLSIRIRNPLYKRTLLPHIRIGSEGAVLMEFLHKNWGILLFGVLMVGFSLVLIAGSAILYVTRIIPGENLFLSAGLFVLLSSLWVLTDSPVMQLFTGSSEGVLAASFFCFMIFPIPMISFVEGVCEKKYPGLFIFRTLFLINCIVQALLNILCELEFSYMLPVTHLLMAAGIIYMIVCLFKEYRKYQSFYAGGILMALFVFMGTAALSFVSFYGNQKDYSVIMRLGMLAYALVLICISVKKMMVSAEEQTKINVYKSLAYVDAMTRCGNHAAFDRAMNVLRKGEGLESWIGMAMIDLNGLKQINDCYGHGTGDQLITGAGACIREAFEGMGEVYRVGGDEFLVILSGKKLEEQEYRRRLAESLAVYNGSHNPVLDLACGISFAAPDKKDVDALYAEADRRMYMEKDKSEKRRT